jgi:hypothetical protein
LVAGVGTLRGFSVRSLGQGSINSMSSGSSKLESTLLYLYDSLQYYPVAMETSKILSDKRIRIINNNRMWCAYGINSPSEPVQGLVVIRHDPYVRQRVMGNMLFDHLLEF